MTTRSQQFELYHAEDDLAPGRVFESLRKLQVWVDDLRDTWWWERFYSKIQRVEVGPARSRRESVGWFDDVRNAGRIEMIPAHRNVRDVTHEVAHVVVGALHGPNHGHDPVFAREYANLVYLISGSAAWHTLQESFVRHGIEYGA